MADPKAKIIIEADGADVLKEARKVSKTMENLGSDIKGAFQRGVSDSGRMLTDLAEKAGSVFGALRNPTVMVAGGLVGLGAAAYQAGKAALGLGMNFETAMANVSTLLDTSKVDISGLGKLAMAVALDLRRPPAMIAEALYEWISANGRIDDGLQEFRQSVKASVAGVTDAKIAVDGMTTILNSYGAEAGGAARVSDLMFQTVNKGKIRFEELASQIGLVVSTAKAAGVPLNDLMAAIATGTAQGIRPSSTMEGLRSAISNIIKPSEQAITTAKLLGLQWGYGALKAKGLAGLLKDVRDKTKGNTEAMAQLFGDISGLNVVLALTGEGAGMFADNLAIMEQAGGATDEAFKKQQSTFTEVVKGLEAIGQAAGTEIYNKFQPYLVGAGQWVINHWPGVLAQLRQTGGDLAGIVSMGLTPFQVAWDAAKGGISAVSLLLQGDFQGAAQAAGRALRDIIGDLTDFKATWESIQLPEWVKTLGTIGVTLAGARLGLVGITAAAQGLAGALGVLEGVLNALAAGSLIKLLGSLVGSGGLAAALVTLADKGAFVVYALGGVIDAVAGLVGPILAAIPGWGWLAAAAVSAATAIYLNWDKVGPWMSGVWESVKQAASTGVEAVKTFFVQTVPRWWDAFGDWLGSTWQGISTWFVELPGKLSAPVVAVATWLGTEIPKWWDAFKKWLGNTWDGISTWLAELPGKMAVKVGFVAGWLSVEIPKWKDAFTKWTGETLTAITTWFTELPGKMAGLVLSVATWLTTEIPKWKDAFTKWTGETLESISGWFGGLTEKFTGWLGKVGTFLVTEVPKQWAAFKTWVGDVETSITTFFGKLPEKFTNWLTDTANAVDKLWETFKEKGRQLGVQVWEGLKSSVTGAINSAVEGAQNTIKDIKEKFAEGFAKGQAAAGGKGGSIPQFATGGIVRHPLLAMIGEGGEEEAVVPRSRAMDFLPTILEWAGLASGAMAPSAPALAGVAGGYGGGGGFTLNGGINLFLQAPPGTDNPEAWGRAAGDAIYSRLANMIKL